MMMRFALCDCPALALGVKFGFVYFTGLTLHLREQDYHSEFTYSLQVNILKLISQFKANMKQELEPKFQFHEVG
ncbi:hypothetical protein CHUAL_010598 [Chamberlinius hualienensis]